MKSKEQLLLEQAYQTVKQPKTINESTGGTAYIIYGDNSNVGIEIFGIFPTEDAAHDAYAKHDEWDEGGYVQIEPIPFGVYSEEPLLKSYGLSQSGVKVNHPPTSSNPRRR